MLICERPWFSQRVTMLARQNGEYVRPVIGHIVDIRIEDFLPSVALLSPFSSNIIGKFPDIPESNQIGRYFIANFNQIDNVNLTKEEAERHMASGEYIMLPDSPSSQLWEHSQAPWWEYAVILDQYDGFIKAPKIPRSGEPTPDDIDERLDKFHENRDSLHVLSPTTLKKWAVAGTTESYLRRLNRI